LADRIFFDTNIFVYSFDHSEPVKQRRAHSLIETSLEARNAVISYQVVQEFLNVATRRFRQKFPITGLEVYLSRVLLPLCEIYSSGRLYSEALSIADETGWGFYDALIVASALAAKCDAIWTEDLQDGRIIRGIEIRNPFRDPRRP
jgi:predicted nucleic acid-binding protein